MFCDLWGQIPVNVYVTQGLAVVGERGLCFLTPAGDTLSFHLVLLFIRRPIFCEYRNANLSDNPEFSRLTLPARNERDHMLHCWLEITLFITVFVIGASLYLLRLNKCWQEYFDCEISYLLKFCMRSSILWVYLVVKTVRTHGWLCKLSSIFDSEFFCIYVVID